MESIQQSNAATNDFLVHYRNISSKLKKRFLRKPNVAEASNEFSRLAHDLSEGEAWPQAGLCCIAVARCEQTLCNAAMEVSALIQAARHFFKAEAVNNQLHCPSFQEHLATAVSCYKHAIQLYQEQKKPALAASISIELGQALRSLNRPSEALQYFQSSSDLLSGHPPDQLTCLGYLASCKLELGDLVGTLTVFSQMISILEQYGGIPLSAAYRDVLTRCEISSLLLLLILKPLPQQKKISHSDLVAKYSYSEEIAENQVDVPFDSCELLLLLQSLVEACQSHDSVSLATLSRHLTPLLDAEQMQLLFILVEETQRI